MCRVDILLSKLLLKNTAEAHEIAPIIVNRVNFRWRAAVDKN